MANDKQLDTAISRWLEAEAPPQLPDRVLRATFERTRRTKQQGGWRAVPGRLHMNGWNKLVPVGIGTAAVVTALVVGVQVFGAGAIGGAGATPSLTASPEPTPAPSFPRVPTSGPIAAGTYLVSDGQSSIRITFPAGWESFDEGRDFRKHKDEPNEVGVALFRPDISVYPDACATEDQPPRTGPTADDLIAALRGQQNSDVSDPADITFGGRPGVRVEVSVPDGLDVAACSEGLLRIWTGANGGNYFAFDAALSHEPQIIDIVQTPSGRIVFAPDTGPNASAADRAERQAIIDSIQIEPVQ